MLEFKQGSMRKGIRKVVKEGEVFLDCFSGVRTKSIPCENWIGQGI